MRLIFNLLKFIKVREYKFQLEEIRTGRDLSYAGFQILIELNVKKCFIVIYLMNSVWIVWGHNYYYIFIKFYNTRKLIYYLCIDQLNSTLYCPQKQSKVGEPWPRGALWLEPLRKLGFIWDFSPYSAYSLFQFSYS